MIKQHKKKGVFEDLFGTKENPTIIPYKSSIQNTKIYFFVIAFSAFLFSGHIQNPDAVREIFVKSGAFSFDNTLTPVEIYKKANNIISTGSAFSFFGYFLFGSIVDYFGIFPCALLAQTLCIIGYSLLTLIHINTTLYYIASAALGLSLSGIFISRSRFMEMFPDNKNSVVMFLTWGMDFSLLLPIFLDILGEKFGSHQTVLFYYSILLFIINLHHCTILPYKLPVTLDRKYPEDMESTQELVVDDNANINDKSISDDSSDSVGLPGYRELPWFRKLFSLPFILFSIYFSYLSLVKIHYLLFFRRSIVDTLDVSAPEVTVRLGNIIFAVVSTLSFLWGLFVDKNGIMSALLVQVFSIFFALLPITFKTKSSLPAMVSSVFSGVFTCYHNALTYSFVSGVFGYSNFGIIHGFTALTAALILNSVNLWQEFLKGPIIQNNLIFLNICLTCSSLIVFILLFLVKISLKTKNRKQV